MKIFFQYYKRVHLSLYHFCDYGHSILVVTAASFLWMGVLYLETFCEFQDKHFVQSTELGYPHTVFYAQ